MWACVLFVLCTATIQVPADYPELSAAISAAEDGDTIILAPGVYSEDREIHLQGKHVVIKGPEAEAKATIKKSVIADGGEDIGTRFENIVFEESLYVRRNASLSLYRCSGGYFWIHGSNGPGLVIGCEKGLLMCYGEGNWRFEDSRLSIRFADGASFLNCHLDGQSIVLPSCSLEGCTVEPRFINADGSTIRNCLFPWKRSGWIYGDVLLEGNVFVLSPKQYKQPSYISLERLSRPVRGNTFYKHVDPAAQSDGLNPTYRLPMVIDVSASPGLLLEGNIIWSDRIDTLPPPHTQVVLGAWAVELRNCLVSNPTVAGSNGNICAYPHLADPASGDMRPLAGSPVIDAGPPDGAPDPDGSRADIGALAFDRRSPLFLRGDPTGDGTIRLSDAFGTLGLLYGGQKLPCVKAADYNDDGNVRLEDALGLLRFLFAGGEPPPPPFPQPGYDETEDFLPCTGLAQ